MATAGSLVIDVIARTGSFSTDMDRTAKDLEKVKKEAYATGQVIGDAFKKIVGALGLGASIAGFVSMIKTTIDAADHLNDLSKKTGIAVDSLGGIGFAATQAGGTLDSVAEGAGKLNKTLAEAAAGNAKASEAFKVLGISVKDAVGQTRSADEVMVDIASRFASFKDGPEKAALALRIFGKAGADMIPLLDDGGNALRDNIEYYKKFAGVTPETAAKADELNDTLGKLKLQSGALGREITTALLPVLQTLSERLLAAKESGNGLVGQLGAVFGFDKEFFAAKELAKAADEVTKLNNRVTILRNGMEIGFYGKGKQKELDETNKLLEVAKQRFREMDEARKNAGLDRLNPLQKAFRPSDNYGPGMDFEKPPAPRLSDAGAASDADALLKKQLDGQLKVIQQFAKDQSEGYKFANKYVEQVRSAGIISLQESFDTERTIRHAAADAEISEQMKIAAEQDAFAVKASKAADKEGAHNAAKVARLKIQELTTQLTRDDALANGENAAALEKITQATRDANDAAKDYLDTMSKQQTRALAAFGHGDAVNALFSGRQQITDKYDDQTRANEKFKRDAIAAKAFNPDAQKKYDEEAERIAKFQAEALASWESYTSARKMMEGDWSNGATRALENYLDSVHNLASQTEGLFTRAFQGMEDALTSFVMTGKADFKSLVNSILADLVRIQIRQQITGPLSQALGSLFGGGIGGGPGMGGAGINGGSTILPDVLRGGAAGGTNMLERDMVTLVHKGEAIVPKAYNPYANPPGMGSGNSQAMKVVVNNHSGGEVRTNQISPNELELVISAAVSRVDRNIASGTGSTASAMKSRGLSLDGALPRRA